MNRVRLKGGLERTSSSAHMNDDGGLVVECFDFSEDALDFFGNDVAFTITVDATRKAVLLQRLGVPLPEDGLDAALLGALAERFESYHAVKQWLEDEQIPFVSAFEPHA